MTLWGLFKKYWDLIVGILTGVIFSILANWNVERIQLIYSIIILLLVDIGLLRIIKKEIEKRQGLKTRQRTIIDKVVDSQTSVKAVELGYHPMRMGEDIGYLCIDSIKKGGHIMKKFKEFFDKFKGYLLTLVLTVLSLVEMFGGYIATAFNDLVVVNGVNMIALATGGCAVVVALFSNSFTKDQRLQIKKMLNNIMNSDSINDEAKKLIKDLIGKIKDVKKLLGENEKDVECMKAELEEVCNTYAKKRSIQENVPDLDLSEELNSLSVNILELKANISDKETCIEQMKSELNQLETNKEKLSQMK